MWWMIALALWGQAEAARPRTLVVVQANGRQKDIRRYDLRKGAQGFLTKSPVEETALLCRKDRVVFVAGNEIRWLDAQKPGQENAVGTLPRELVSAMGNRLRHFLRWSHDGSLLAFPGSTDIFVKGIGSAVSHTISPDPGVRVVHPVFWRPGAAELAYLTQSDAQVALNLHPVSRVQPRLAVTVVQARGTVTASDMHFSADGKMLALNLDFQPEKGRIARYFLLLDAEKGQPVALSPSWKIEKFHGFSPKGELVFSGSVGGPMSLVYLSPANPKNPQVLEHLLKRDVYEYIPRMDLTLLHTAGQKCEDRPRLIALDRRAQDRRLLKWAEWTEILALDSTRVWGIFRAGGACDDPHPALYLMRMDGSGLFDEMPKNRFSVLQGVSPEQAAICD